MDKSKKGPLPDKTGRPKGNHPSTDEKQSTADPQYIRGTIEPPTKKGS